MTPLRLTSLLPSGLEALLLCRVLLLFSMHQDTYAVCFCRRIDMVEELEKVANLNIPKDLSSDEANKYLIDACAKFEIECPPPQTTARLLDKVNFFLPLLPNSQFL